MKKSFLILLVFSTNLAFGQYNVTATKQSSTPVVSKLIPIPYQNIADWKKGLQFIMRSNFDAETAKEKTPFYTVKNPNTDKLETNMFLTYKSFADKIFTVYDVKETKDKDDNAIVAVRLQCDGNYYQYDFEGTLADFKTSRQTINGLVPLQDLKEAKAKLEGKKFPIEISNWMQTTSDGGFELYQNYNGKKETVTITKVGYGRDEGNPIRLVFKANDGKEYFVDVCISRTNSNYVVDDNFVPDNFIDNILNVGKEYFTNKKGEDLPAIDQSALEQKMLIEGVKLSTVQQLWGVADKIVKKDDGKTELTYNNKNALLIIENDILVASHYLKGKFDDLKIGMSRKQCKDKIGIEPTTKRTSQTENKSREYWIYGRNAILVFDVAKDKLIQLEKDERSKSYQDISIEIGLE